MKRTLILAIVAFFAGTSCKKEYACGCTTVNTTYTNSVAIVYDPVTEDVKTGKMTKAAARKKCKSMNGTISNGNTEYGVKSEISCSLK
jgi:hypothetical protein